MSGGQPPAISPVRHGLAPIIPLCGVRVRYTLAKQVGTEPLSIGVPRGVDDLNAKIRQADELLRALRVFRSGNVKSLGHIAFCDTTLFGSYWSFTSNSSRAHAAALFSNEYTLTRQDGGEFAAFWGDLETARRKLFIENAIRRFGYAGDRDLPDDKLVDLMIAAESLFLYEIDDQDRGELSYRLSQRAAFFISEAPGPSRHDVFRLMRNAYRVRSVIVHGGVPGNDLLRTSAGRVSMSEFVESVERLLRLALRKMIQVLRQSGVAPPDWNTLTFG